MNIIKGIIIVGISLVILSGCNDKNKVAEAPEGGTSDFLINATLWYQHSAEMRACYYQAFNIAKLALDNNLREHSGDKPPAIVFDLDETILDNSFYEAQLIFDQETYNPESWKKWSDRECAQALPGAVEFVEYAFATGVEIFYVSNRMEDEIESTFSNIRKLGFPEIPIENYIFRTEESSKTARRNIIRENYDIILLLGDNLNDFSGIFEDRDKDNGFEAVDKNKDMFGTKYIVFPNPMYGNWEYPLTGNENYTPHQNRLRALIGVSEICKKM